MPDLVLQAATGVNLDLGYVPPPSATPLLASPYASTANVTTSGALSLTTAVSAGEMILVIVHCGGSGLTLTVSDSTTESWSSSTKSENTGAATTTQIFWVSAANAHSVGSTITVNRSVAGGLVVEIYKLPAGFSPNLADASDASSSVATTAVSSAGVTVPNGGFLLAAGTTQTARTAAPTAPSTLLDDAESSGGTNSRYGWSQSHYFATGTTVTPAATLSSGNAWSFVAIVFEPGSSSVADAGPDLPYARTSDTTITLDGSASVGTTYLWTQLTGTTVTLSGSTTDTATFAPPAHPEVLTFQLQVDGGPTDTVTVTITPSRHVAEIGDSLTERQTTSAAPPDRYDETLQRLFDLGVWPDCQNVTQAAMGYYWYGKGGKAITAADANGKTTVQNIAEARTALGTIDVWVIALCTNNVGDSDPTFEANMQTVIDEIASEGETVWINMVFWNPANTNALHFNPIIASKCSANGVRLGDWFSQVHNPFVSGDWIGAGDPTHMTEQGYYRRDTFIANQIKRALGDGPMFYVWNGTVEVWQQITVWNGTTEVAQILSVVP